MKQYDQRRKKNDFVFDGFGFYITYIHNFNLRVLTQLTLYFFLTKSYSGKNKNTCSVKRTNVCVHVLYHGAALSVHEMLMLFCPLVVNCVYTVISSEFQIQFPL